MTNSKPEISVTVSKKTKSIIVSYNKYGLFKDNKASLMDERKRIKFFDQKWSNGINASLKNSLREERMLTDRLVRHKLTETKWSSKALEYVKPNKLYCEFKYDGLLCIAQLEEYDDAVFELENLWGLRYSNVPPEVICINLGTEKNKKRLEAAAMHFGERYLEFSKEAVLEKTERVLKNLESQNQDLVMELESLKEERRQVNIGFYKKTIIDFQERLKTDYPEASGNSSWQKWIYNNNWLFGIQYDKPIQQEIIGLNSIVDYLFPTIDGFVDILEIKLPKHKVIREDSSHPGSFICSSDANKAIGQVVNYLHKIEINQLSLYQALNRKYAKSLNSQISFIKPRAFIVIGRSND